jgi:hypothetical protein
LNLFTSAPMSSKSGCEAGRSGSWNIATTSPERAVFIVRAAGTLAPPERHGGVVSKP